LVDGLQRVATFVSFFGALEKDISNIIETDEEKINLLNNWELESGSLLNNLNGFTIHTLPTKYILNLKRAVCRVEILKGQSNNTMKYELFKRLNSNSSPLTPQEVRNAIYRAVNPKLNELVLELSQDATFQRLTNLSKQKQRELYDQELVLKFFAFLDNIEDINDNTQNFLDSFMEKTVNNPDFDYDSYKNRFVKALNLIGSIQDENIFRTKNNKLFVPSEFEGIMIGVAQNFHLYENNLELLKQRIKELKEDSKFKEYSGTASNSKSRIKKRLTRANEIFSKV